MADYSGMILKTCLQITGIKNKRTFLSQSTDSPMSNRKYIHLDLFRCKLPSRIVHAIKLNGNKVWLEVGKDYTWGNLNQGSKNPALAICKELYPGHENDLHEKFLKDYIGKLKDSDIVEVSLDITEFCQYARDVIRIKQEAGVESIEDCLPF